MSNEIINTCDCLIGFVCGESVSKSTIDYEVNRIFEIQPVFEKLGILKGEPLSKKQIVDNRRGNLSRFAYCPYCGTKIKWNQILEKFKQ